MSTPQTDTPETDRLSKICDRFEQFIAEFESMERRAVAAEAFNKQMADVYLKASGELQAKLRAAEARVKELEEAQSDDGPQAASKADEPATFDAHGKTWTRHTPGDPCPCDPEAILEVLLRGEMSKNAVYSRIEKAAKEWSWENRSSIIGWRYADEPAQAEKEDVETIKRERDSLKASLEADKEWIIKAHSMLDDRRWAGKSEMEGLVTELEEAWQEIKELVLPEPTQPWTPRPGDVVCDWFDDGGCLDSKAFPAACLTPAKEDR